MNFIIMGDPVAKGRPRLGRFGTYTPTKTREAEDRIKSEIQFSADKVKSKIYLEAAVSLEINFYVKIPKTKKRGYPVSRPDVDNYSKLIMDACNGILWNDDSQVITLIARKHYHENPHTEISVNYIGVDIVTRVKNGD